MLSQSAPALDAPVTDVLPASLLLRALRALRRGDTDVSLAGEYVGLGGEIARELNDVIDLHRRLTLELGRVSHVVGKAGRLSQRALVPDAAGSWASCLRSVNDLIEDLVQPTTDVARVIGAVAAGNLSETMTLDVDGRRLRGEFLRTAQMVNGMVEQLSVFASEVTRVAREVGMEGKLGGQARVKGVAGTWKDLTDNVNLMAGNLTSQVRNIAEVTTAVAKGDLSKKITVDVKGEILAAKNTINTMVDQLNAFASEVTRVAREVGTEGKLGGQAKVPGVSGTWEDLTDSVNTMASNLTGQVRNIAEVTTAVAEGDLSKKVTVDVKGEMLALKKTINTMVDQLNAFASEVTRVAREVGTEGKLGGQAKVPGVAGTWMDLTDNVNSMASNLTNQVRGIARVVTAVAGGDLTHKLALEARGEIAELASTINGMTGTLAIFAEQVITVAREVGVEGRLGGQAKVPGAAGTWRDLTNNVNQLAENLTSHIRAIGTVATAVTKGDLTRYVAVEASGEMAALKDNINEMIRNLRETTQKTTEQDWLKTNLARFARLMQGQRDLATVARQILSELAPLVRVQQGAFYIAESDGDGDGEMTLNLLASYASPRDLVRQFRLGEGLVGQCALEKRKLVLEDVSSDYYRVHSGLGSSSPRSLIILPVLFEGEVNAAIELASLGELSPVHEVFLDQLTESIGIVVNTISASMRTEALLMQSQSLTQELQSQQEELRQTNEQLQHQAATLQQSEERLTVQQEELRRTNEQLEEKAKLLEIRNREIEFAKADIEEKAEQLGLTSRYKSEFVANMSHELRTPLNSLLILSRMLADNADGNLTNKQVAFAQTIHASGNDLLSLINDILDLSKIESGTLAVEPSEVLLEELLAHVEQGFRHVAHDKGLDFTVELAGRPPPAIFTDPKRLQQVLKNLLSNAFKFTERGSVTMTVSAASYGWSRDHVILNRAECVVAFSVNDTGMGIAEDKQRIIFEAFQQADGTTSRRFGGTGLGLSISREIANLLGGEIRVVSVLGSGSTFTFYLPSRFVPPHTERSRRPAPALPSPALASERPSTRPAAPERAGAADGCLLLLGDDAQLRDSLRRCIDELRSEGLALDAPVSEELRIDPQQAAKLQPSAVVLDLRSRELDAWMALDRLKHSLSTAHLPVLALVAAEDRQKALAMGAAAVVVQGAAQDIHAAELDGGLAALAAFAGARPRQLLVVDEDARSLGHLVSLLSGEGVDVRAVSSSEEARLALAADSYQCVVLSLGQDDRLLELLGSTALGAPVIVHSPRLASDAEALTISQQRSRLRIELSHSPEQLLRESCLLLHRPADALSSAQRRLLLEAMQRRAALTGLRVLIIDDDVRNIFAMTSALERHGAVVTYADNGQQGLELLNAGPPVQAVLVDIMMPALDGYEVMRRIREQPRHRTLPVIAVTAKAMAADREKCLHAGATHYLAKPIDADQLVSALRVATTT